MELNTLIEFMNNYKDINDNNLKQELISLCCSYNLNFNYENGIDNTINKLIFRIKKNNNNKNQLIYYYCNGLVIDSKNKKYLSIPPMAFNKNYTNEIISKYMEHYDLFKIIDGTIITIYYHDSRWCISSSNGYDVSSFYWIGKLTYAAIIYDLINRLYPSVIDSIGIKLIDNEYLEFDNLNTNFSYTIGFRHHNFHPLLIDPEYIWNVQHTNLNTLEVVFNDGILGLPNQILIENKYTIDQLLTINKESYDNRSKNINIHYGFILRSKNQIVTKEYSNILLDNTLLKKIKKNIYDYPSHLNRQYIDHNNRFQFIAIKNYFNKFDKNEMLLLYPQLLEYYNVYNKYVIDIVKCIIIIIKNKKANLDSHIHDDISIVMLSKALYKHISKNETIDPFDKNVDSIIKDYIMNPEYSMLFLHTINNYK